EIGMKEKKFIKVNDLPEDTRIETGKYYYTEKKKTSADVATHVVQPGETLWSISQKYGIRLASLKSKNRIRRDSELKVGMVLNLQEPRKRGEEIPVVKVESPKNTPTVLASQETNPSNQTAVEASTPRRSEETITSSPRTASSSDTYHIVSKGETLFAISRKYGITVDQLKSWNKIGSNNIISVGQKLVIFKP
ncbi:MAG: lytic transglycosylase, partial [Algoriphagus sp. 32-45-6]